MDHLRTLLSLEVTDGFKPPALRFCKPLPWVSRARHHLKLERSSIDDDFCTNDEAGLIAS